MWNFLSNFLDNLKNVSKKKIVGTVIIIATLILVCFPYIDTNFFYSNRIKARIDILEKITNLDVDKINKNEKLEYEYNNIIDEINNSDKNYLNKILSKDSETHKLGKFISGGLLWWILAIIILFYRSKDSSKKKEWITRIVGFILLIILGGICGWICTLMPTIINQWVNYIAVPIIVIVIMFLLFYTNSKKEV